MMKDNSANSIIISRFDPSIRPDFGSTRRTAKELFDEIAMIYRPVITYSPVITVDIYQTVKALHSVKLTKDNTLTYCEEFQRCLQQHRIATE